MNPESPVLLISSGSLTVICGSMFSGKTEELIRRIRRALYARKKVQVFKPDIDTRNENTQIRSHNGLLFDAVTVRSGRELWERTDPTTDLVALEEIQFFDPEIVPVCQKLADRGHQVVAAGLDMDFRGCPFGSVPALMAVADEVVKLHAVCARCGAEASRSQRLIDGRPAPLSAPTVLIGASEHYEARCRRCHQAGE
ncbi:MAG: thymidine kinase [Capsulimonadales bacterium]|nr:thymidine kinase [Capsulimonadales bacterium]